MGYSTNAKNSMLDHLAGEAVFVSLHESDPGDNGAGEISGGSPAYVRKAITWDPAAAGSLNSSNQPVLDVPAGKTISFVGFWSAESGGDWKGSADVDDEVFTNQGTYTLTDADLDLNA